MAQKRRSHNNDIKSVSINNPSVLAAGYVRLSVIDTKNEGDSIETQKKIILDYINNHPDLQFSDFYIDEGVSGTTFERPAFTKMKEDVEKGRIGCVVVKDVTRFGRNMYGTGFYVTKYFPSRGIRFISINDDFDSVRDNAELVFAIKNMFSEYYATDIGNKVRSVIERQMKDGKFIGSRPPFGYVKAVQDCHQLVVDEPAADTVMQIFKWAEKGKSISEIVRLLNSRNTITPSHHWLQTGVIQNTKMTGDGRWQARTVSKILSNEVYTGKLVQGKTKIAHKKQQAAESDALIEIENAHKPIISPKLFMEVQEILGGKGKKDRKQDTVRQRDTSKKRPHLPNSPNLFVGKIVCAHCGSSLNRKKNHQIYIYRCTTKYSAPGRCVGNSIKEEALIQVVAGQLIQYIETIPEDNFPDATLVKRELEALQVELSCKDEIVPRLFESLHNGDISEDDFRELKSMYQRKFDRLEEQYTQLAIRYEEQKAEREDRRKLKSALSEFSKTMELTQYLVDELLGRIEVYKDGRVFIEFKTNN